ncbi:MAG: GNAT family N-acetyltransferase [Lentisphaeria bacterium]
MNEPTYAAITPADYAEIRALWNATPGMGLGAADSAAGIAALLARNPGCCFLCRATLTEPGTPNQPGTLAGTILAGHDGRRGYLYHLAVRPEFRRRGIASELLRRALAGLTAAGITKAHVFVFDTNADGKAFWARHFTRRHDLALFSGDLG